MELHGVTFNGKHTWKDWGLMLLGGVAISPPEVQSTLVEVPGRDGLLRLTDILDGLPHYYSRSWSALFLVDDWDNFDNVVSNVLDALHGRQLTAVSDDDPNYYYVGEFTVDSVDYAAGLITITGTVDPYKYEILSSTEYADWLWDDLDLDDGIIRDYNDLPVAGLLELTIPGRRMPVTPVFDVSDIGEDGLVVEYQGSTYELSEGKNTVLGIRLTEGDNLLRFIGSGVVTVEYRGGRL